MQTVGPYALREVLGVGSIGRIWRGTDQQGAVVTVAVLEEPAASDPQARWRFNSYVDGLRQAPQGAPVNVDPNAVLPWAAFPDDGGAAAAGVFAAMGAPVGPPLDGGADAQVTAVPVDPFAPPIPSSGPPVPSSVPPVSPTPTSPQLPDEYVQRDPLPPTFEEYPLSAPQGNRFADYSPPRRRRTGLVVGLVIVVVVLLAGGVGGAVYLTRGQGTPQTHGSPSAAATTPSVQSSAPSTPKNPGKEPPVESSWPSIYARFHPDDKIKEMRDLPGLGFDFAVPVDWYCAKQDQSTSYVNYHCEGRKTTTGGDLIVRDCPSPCDQAIRDRMRKQEEAFGLQWETDGDYGYYAHSDSVRRPDGTIGYGFVMLRFWHSVPGGQLDREVVLRFTAPHGGSIELHKVANSVRDATH